MSIDLKIGKKETDTKEPGTLVERLFGAGAHFGFTRSRRHPTAKPYLFGNKQGTDIFDLEKTEESIADVKNVLLEAGKNGKTVLFVGTKEEIAPIVRENAERVEMPLVVNRWIGGMLTNFGEIKKRIKRLEELAAQKESGELERKYTKKERVILGREHDKLFFNFDGIRKMEKLPDFMIVVDPRHDSIAVREAHDANVPVIGITSSDYNLRMLTHAVVANDALQSSVRLLLDELTKSFLEGKENQTAQKEGNEEKKSA